MQANESPARKLKDSGQHLSTDSPLAALPRSLSPILFPLPLVPVVTHRHMRYSWSFWVR